MSLRLDAATRARLRDYEAMFGTSQSDQIREALRGFYMSQHFSSIVAGMDVEAALDAFEGECRIPNETLWITSEWWAPRRQEIVARAPNPITAELAEALRSVGLKEHPLDDLIDFLRLGRSARNWTSFAAARKEQREKKAEQERAEWEARRALENMAVQPDTVGVFVPTRLALVVASEGPRPFCPRCALSGSSIRFDSPSGGRYDLRVCPQCRTLLDVARHDEDDPSGDVMEPPVAPTGRLPKRGHHVFDGEHTYLVTDDRPDSCSGLRLADGHLCDLTGKRRARTVVAPTRFLAAARSWKHPGLPASLWSRTRELLKSSGRPQAICDDIGRLFWGSWPLKRGEGRYMAPPEDGHRTP